VPSVRFLTKKRFKGFEMRLLTIVAFLAALPWAVAAAPTWQTISSEPGKRIELDRANLKRDENGKVLALGRVILEKELIDAKSGAGYRVIEATTRYDCLSRNANTIKRVFKKNEKEIIREEEIKGNDLPVRAGTLDDKVLREVCRPPKDSALEVAEKANEAATLLKAANDELIKKELAKEAKSPVVKTADAGHAAAPADAPKSAIPSIRPNLKADAEAARGAPPTPVKEVAPAPAPAPMPKAVAPAHSSTVIVHSVSKPVAPRVKPKEKLDGYMLEVKHGASAEAHRHIHWSYEGEGAPENWSKIDPNNNVCAIGQRQSPIDIREGIKVDLEPVKFDYRPSTFRIVDNGHTVQVNVGDSRITLTGKTYELVQFHFHRPSEEKVNGRRFDMVAHMVHKADDGALAVVAVLLERGQENPFIQTLWNNLPLEKNAPVSPPLLSIDPLALLPAARDDYTYMGSLTTPPCTEGVLWLVMKQPVQVSSDQIGIFSRLYPNNVRPIQPSANRMIKEGR
jgi:carbonic anhydrase